MQHISQKIAQILSYKSSLYVPLKFSIFWKLSQKRVFRITKLSIIPRSFLIIEHTLIRFLVQSSA